MSSSTSSEKEVLVLGCGLISAPLIDYLAFEANFNVRIATRTLDKTKVFTEKSPRITGKIISSSLITFD